MINADYILTNHKISLKTTKGRNGSKSIVYSIQFTYPKGIKKQFTGRTKEEVQIKVHSYFNSNLITYNDLCEKWLNYLEEKYKSLHKNEKKIKRQTSSVRYTVEKFIPYFDNKPIILITTDNIQETCKKILDTGCKTGTVNYMIRALRNMYKYAIDNGFTETNPAEKVKMFQERQSKFERNYLSDKEMVDFIRTCKINCEFIYPVYLLSGIPIEYFITLKWKDIDFKNNTICISHQIEDRDSAIVVELPRVKRYRTEEPELVFEFLYGELKYRSHLLGISATQLQKSSRNIICNKAGYPTSVQAFYNKMGYFIKKYCKGAYTASDIHFTSAVYAMKAGCSIPAVASMVGMNKAIKMFNDPNKFGCFDLSKERNVNQYIDDIFFN